MLHGKRKPEMLLPAAHSRGVLSLAEVTVAGRPVSASGGHDRTIRFWEQSCNSSLALIGQVECPGSVFSLAAAEQSDTLLSGGGTERQAKLWDLRPSNSSNSRTTSDVIAECVASMGDHTGWVRDVLSFQGYLFTVGCNYVNVWQFTAESGLQSLGDLEVRGDITSLTGLLWPEDGQPMLYCSTNDGRIHSWGIQPAAEWKSSARKAGRLLAGRVEYRGSFAAHADRITGLVSGSSNASNSLFSVSHDGFLRQWDCSAAADRLELTQELELLQCDASSVKPLCLSVHQEGTPLACGLSDGCVVVLRSGCKSSGKLSIERKQQQHDGDASVMAVLCTSSGAIVSGAADGSLALFNG